MLPLTANLVASEAMAASKQPRRSHLTSKSNSVTSITHDPMSLGLLNGPINSILTEEEEEEEEEEGQLSSIDLRGFAAGKNGVQLSAPLINVASG